MFGMPAGFADFLAQKYALLQQNANADTTRAQAALLQAQSGSNLDNTRAGLLPAESKANNALTFAQTGLAGANTRNVDVTTQLAPQLARSTIAHNTAEIGNIGAETDFTRSRTTSVDQLNKYFPRSMLGSDSGGMPTPNSYQDSIDGNGQLLNSNYQRLRQRLLGGGLY
jgi:hypothetical protein